MKIILGARGSGKSIECIRWAAQDPLHRVVVTHTIQAARTLVGRAARMFPDYDWTNNFVSAHEAGAKFRGRGEVELWVDELDQVLAALLWNPVTGATVTDVEPYELGERVT